MDEISYKSKCLEMVMRLVSSYLEEHYSTNHTENIKKIVNNDAFDRIREGASESQIDKMNTFVGQLMSSISKDKYDKHVYDALSVIAVEVRSLLSVLLTEEEAKDFYEFGTSATGQKVLRNLDLFRNAVQVGRNIILTEIIAEWSDPETTTLIDDYIKRLGAE